MSNELQRLVGRNIFVMTCEGRVLIGKLRGVDTVMNLTMSDLRERLFRGSGLPPAEGAGETFMAEPAAEGEGVEEISLGTMVVRGDNVAVVGEIDEDIESQIDWSSVAALPLPPIKH
ncbi:hypothetical protein H696_04392 [Fonticula alba]|uniref:U6 snRNA-associated Sm-like protein LSm8 n=1 Tax=Fonticula alba TaxID=691883 RepID=A0A058Z657_FONAL|nr:hypothetical protein H696_04392 [Fonticula alba]KCV68972.1 hypothetical protein H696_04392 [Fonticula alba]|eukprot:XP_009496543.1 hypothetical protein H696_04392 [Fonticula alba]